MRVFFKSDKKTGHPMVWVTIYMCALLLLFFLGVIENRVDSEGMGFFPLLILTTPWSWLLMGLWDAPLFGSSLVGRHLAIFLTCNVISGALNSSVLYLLLRWRQRKAAGESKP